jgi:hypothetical protein
MRFHMGRQSSVGLRMKYVRLISVVGCAGSITWLIDRLYGPLVLHMSLAAVVLAEFAAVSIGIAAGWAIYKRLGDRLEILRNWVGSAMATGASLQLAYSYYQTGHLPGDLFGLWVGTSPGALYAVAAATLVMLWWYRPETITAKGALLAVDQSFNRLHFLWSFIGFVVFRIAVGIAAGFGLYLAWTWIPVAIPSGRPDNPSATIITFIWNIDAVRFVAGLGFAIIIVLSIWELWRLLIGLISAKPPLESEKAHGDARHATLDEAIAAATGTVPKPPWATKSYRD